MRQIEEIYNSSGHPSGCFNLCPDLRKSTTSIPVRPGYGVTPGNEKENKSIFS